MRKYAKISKVRSQVCSHWFLFNDFLCGRITCKSLQSAQKKPKSLSLIIAAPPNNYPQNNKTHKPSQPVFLCEIMQHAAFLCVICAISGRMTCKHTQSISTNETPMSPADHADNRRRNPKRQNSKPHQPVFLCEIMQLCCIRLRNLRYLRENNTQEYSSNPHRRNHNISRRSRR